MADCTRGLIRFGTTAGLALGWLAAGPGNAATAGRVDLERACAREAPAGVDVRDCIRDGRRARRSTARYQDAAVALADGFIPTGGCEGSAEGAMGQHWARVERMADQALDPRRPELLLHLSSTSGPRLVAVEWSAPALGPNGEPCFGPLPPPGPVSDPPRLFGRAFDGPMAGHVPIQPWHHDLHVWLWADDPNGLFAPHNPRLSCTPSGFTSSRWPAW